jgi:hypothetical protein
VLVKGPCGAHQAAPHSGRRCHTTSLRILQRQGLAHDLRLLRMLLRLLRLLRVLGRGSGRSRTQPRCRA